MLSASHPQCCVCAKTILSPMPRSRTLQEFASGPVRKNAFRPAAEVHCDPESAGLVDTSTEHTMLQNTCPNNKAQTKRTQWENFGGATERCLPHVVPEVLDVLQSILAA